MESIVALSVEAPNIDRPYANIGKECKAHRRGSPLVRSIGDIYYSICQIVSKLSSITGFVTVSVIRLPCRMVFMLIVQYREVFGGFGAWGSSDHGQRAKNILICIRGLVHTTEPVVPVEENDASYNAK